MGARTADVIADAVENMIVTGEVDDGVRLNEAAVAERFGVSRTPVREAFQKLTSTGLVEQIPRRGVFVRHPGPIELLEMFEVMAEYEAICGRLAAGRISDAALAELREANRRCRAAAEAEDADGYYRENEVFHHIVYRESGNGFLAQEAARLHRRLRPFRRMQLHLRGRLRQSMDEHERIVERIAEGDGEAAAAELRLHVAVQGEKFQRLVASLGR